MGNEYYAAGALAGTVTLTVIGLVLVAVAALRLLRRPQSSVGAPAAVPAVVGSAPSTSMPPTPLGVTITPSLPTSGRHIDRPSRRGPLILLVVGAIVATMGGVQVPARISALESHSTPVSAQTVMIPERAGPWHRTPATGRYREAVRQLSAMSTWAGTRAGLYRQEGQPPGAVLLVAQHGGAGYTDYDGYWRAIAATEPVALSPVDGHGMPGQLRCGTVSFFGTGPTTRACLWLDEWTAGTVIMLPGSSSRSVLKTTYSLRGAAER